MSNEEAPQIPKPKRRRLSPKQKAAKRRAYKEKVLANRSDKSAFIRHLTDACEVCYHPERAEIEIAYTTGALVGPLADTFGVKKGVLRAHADAMEWTTARLRNTDAVMSRLYGDVLDSLDVEKLSPRDKIEFLTHMAREQNRIQGRIISKMDINANKSVTFVGIPLPGGAPPILPEGKKLLAKGVVIEAQFLQEGESDESGEAVEAAGSLPPGAGQGAEAGSQPGSDGKQRF